MRWIKRIAIGIGVYFVISLCVAGSLAAFCHPDPPRALKSATEPFATMDL